GFVTPPLSPNSPTACPALAGSASPMDRSPHPATSGLPRSRGVSSWFVVERHGQVSNLSVASEGVLALLPVLHFGDLSLEVPLGFRSALGLQSSRRNAFLDDQVPHVVGPVQS